MSAPGKAYDFVRQHGRNSLAALSNQIIFLMSGLVTFYVIGRELGVEGYGAYAAALAVAHLIAPFAQVGCTHLAVRQLSRTGSMSTAWSTHVSTTILGGALASAFLLAAQPLLSPGVPRLALGLLAFSEIAFAAAVQGGVLLTESIQRASIGSRLRTAATGLRLVALLPFAFFDLTVTGFALAHLTANILATALSSQQLAKHLEARLRFKPVQRSEFSAGLGFASNHLAGTVQTDADKAVLAFYELTRETGIYAAGYRITKFASLPLTVIVNSTYGTFFKLGAESLGVVRRFARRTTALAVGANLPICTLLWLAAPVVPRIFGEGFDESVEVIRWLAFLPMIKSFQYFAGNALTGADLQRYRTSALAVTATVNVVLNLALIPTYTWRGAVAATLASEILLAIMLWAILETRSPDLHGEAYSQI